MRKIIISFLVLSCVLAGCKKGQYLLYGAPDNIHFNFVVPTVDSIVYTFAFTPGQESDTVYVPMQLSGTRVNRDRQYMVAVTDSNTTAIEGEHYAKLQQSYVLPADSGTTRATHRAITRSSTAARAAARRSRSLPTSPICTSCSIDRAAWTRTASSERCARSSPTS